MSEVNNEWTALKVLKILNRPTTPEDLFRGAQKLANEINSALDAQIMRDQPNQSCEALAKQGEWTPRHVYQLYRKKTYGQIADAINAALAAERKKVK